MYKINMSEAAKSAYGENWYCMDTYRAISQETILNMDADGFDLIQIVNEDNTHGGFEWQKRQ